MRGETHYRLHLRPKSGRGEFYMIAEVVISDIVLFSGRTSVRELLQMHAEDAARRLMGAEHHALRCFRVEQRYVDGWREVRFPIPYTPLALVAWTHDEQTGEEIPASNVFPTWPA